MISSDTSSKNGKRMKMTPKPACIQNQGVFDKNRDNEPTGKVNKDRDDLEKALWIL